MFDKDELELIELLCNLEIEKFDRDFPSYEIQIEPIKNLLEKVRKM